VVHRHEFGRDRSWSSNAWRSVHKKWGDEFSLEYKAGLGDSGLVRGQEQKVGKKNTVCERGIVSQVRDVSGLLLVTAYETIPW